MTTQKAVPRPTGLRCVRGEGVKDEVYRQMFLLEECRPGAETGLALALLRAWLEAGTRPACKEEQDWLKQVSPICLEMIEAAVKAIGPSYPRSNELVSGSSQASSPELPKHSMPLPGAEIY